MMLASSVRSWLLLPLLTVTATACLATRGNVRLLQEDIRVLQGELAQAQQQTQQLVTTLRTETAAAHAAEAQADSAHRLQLQQALAAIGRVSDTVAAVNDRLLRLRADYLTDQGEVSTQLMQVQQSLGTSQRTLAQVNDRIDSERGRAAAAQDTATASRAVTVATMLEAARQQWNNQSYQTARGAYKDILTQPNLRPDQGAEALTGIAQTYEAESQGAVADSIYQLVPQQFPGTPYAATALYKHGDYLAHTQRVPEANAVFQRIVTEYPASDEAQLAKGRMSSPAGP